MVRDPLQDAQESARYRFLESVRFVDDIDAPAFAPAIEAHGTLDAVEFGGCDLVGAVILGDVEVVGDAGGDDAGECCLARAGGAADPEGTPADADVA